MVLTQKPVQLEVCRVIDVGALSQKWDVIFKPWPSWLSDLFKSGVRKTVEASDGAWLQGNTVIQAQQDLKLYQPAETVTSPKPTQLKTRQKSDHERGGESQSHNPNQKLLQLIPSEKGKANFSNGVSMAISRILFQDSWPAKMDLISTVFSTHLR